MAGYHNVHDNWDRRSSSTWTDDPRPPTGVSSPFRNSPGPCIVCGKGHTACTSADYDPKQIIVVPDSPYRKPVRVAVNNLVVVTSDDGRD